MIVPYIRILIPLPQICSLEVSTWLPSLPGRWKNGKKIWIRAKLILLHHARQTIRFEIVRKCIMKVSFAGFLLCSEFFVLSMFTARISWDSFRWLFGFSPKRLLFACYQSGCRNQLIAGKETLKYYKDATTEYARNSFHIKCILRVSKGFRKCLLDFSENPN